MIDINILKYFAGWIEKETGIIYHDENYFQLSDRIEKLFKQFNFTSAAELMQKFETGPSRDMKQQLVDIATNNETSFFRDSKLFSCLENQILPSLVSTVKNLQDLQIWSLAASTGQEPYSVSFILHDLGAKYGQEVPTILATDISSRALERAKEARYSELEISRGLPERLKKLYFKQDTKKMWMLDKKIVQKVDFKYLNLLSPFQLDQKFDLILCRNILIYQRIEAKKEILKKIVAQLNLNGVLILGAGESLMGLSADFDQALIDGVSFYRKKTLIQKAG